MKRFVLLLILLLTPQVSAQIQLVSPDKERILRSYIPKLGGFQINEKLEQAFLFTDAEIPPARQVRLSNGMTVFFHAGANPQVAPGPTAGIRWIYPAGAVVFDVLLKSFSDHTWASYTVRVREREIDDWDANSYVPFRNVNCLKLIGDSGTVTSRYADELAKTFWVLELPPISGARNLLRSRIFEPQSGEPFMSAEDHEIFAPTANDHDNIVPANYLGSAIGSDRESCRSCHRNTLAPLRAKVSLTSVSTMEGPQVIRISKVKAIWLPDNPSGGVWPIVAWRGPLQAGAVFEEGSDGIRTFHPIDPESIGPPAKAPRLRDSLVKAGIVAWYDPAKHPSSVYQQIPAYSNY